LLDQLEIVEERASHCVGGCLIAAHGVEHARKKAVHTVHLLRVLNEQHHLAAILGEEFTLPALHASHEERSAVMLDGLQGAGQDLRIPMASLHMLRPAAGAGKAGEAQPTRKLGHPECAVAQLEQICH
jgi:hypothetical protein